jgi:putative membrane protein
MKTRLATYLTLTFFALFTPLPALAQQTPQPEWYGPGPWHMWGGGWGFGWMFPLFMLIVFVVCIVFVFGRGWGGGHHHWGPGRSWSDPTFSALQILNERYAKGEIQKQEYEEKKAAILSGGHR